MTAAVGVQKRLKRTAKRALAGSLYTSGLLSLLMHRRFRQQCLVLTYHRVLSRDAVEKTCSSPGIVVTRETFECHLRLLKRHFRVLTLAEFESHVRTQMPFPSGACLLTFDDGWLDTYTEAWPLLRRYGVPAVVFLPVSYIGTGRMFWQEELTYLLVAARRAATNTTATMSRLRDIAAEHAIDVAFDEPIVHDDILQAVQRKKGSDSTSIVRLIESLAQLVTAGERHAAADAFLTWDMAREMAADGVTFGAHSVTHRIMTTLTRAELVDEVRGSRYRLRQELPAAVESFSYPNGSWDNAVRAEVVRQGFAISFTTAPGPVSVHDDRFAIHRVNVHQDATSTEGLFLARVSGIL